MIYEFKITLKEMPIPVWRKIQIHSESTFNDLHRVIQAAFNWYDSHLHSFFVNKTNGEKAEFVQIELESEFEDFGPSSPFAPERKTYKEGEEKLSSWFKLVKDKVIYIYDFGDNWEHEVVLTKILKAESGIQYPRCIAAKNAAPSENSRGELLMGEIDLEADEKELLSDIHEEIKDELSDLLTEAKGKGNDYWLKVLQASKEFQKLKPWNHMSDDQIFAVQDPITKELLFCSVMGAAGEMYGLAVYIGEEGFHALIATVERVKSQLQILSRQRSIVVSFEDREDLQKEDYALIKSYDISFRGRKAWPAFISYKPGFYPWMMDNEEARLMLVALQGAMEVFNEIKAGFELPDVFMDEKAYTKVPMDVEGNPVYENKIIDLDPFLYPEENESITLAVSEIEVKRAEKLEFIPATVEFVIEYIDMPFQNNSNERPVFPLMVIAVDHEQGLVVYQNVLQGEITPEIYQSELVKVFQTIGGIPDRILMDYDSNMYVLPLEEILELEIITDDYTSIAYRILEDFQNNMY